MKQIQLTRGHIAFVDDEDYERINKRRWFAVVGLRYIRAARQQMRRMIYMHYEVLQLQSKSGKEIDHIDGNSLNNTKSNLRLVTHTENMQNTSRHKNRIGYSYNWRASAWSVYLDSPGKQRRYLGYTKTKKEAIVRIEEARREDSQN